MYFSNQPMVTWPMKCMWIGICDLHQYEPSTDLIEATLPAARRRRTSWPRHCNGSSCFFVNLQSKLDIKTPKLDAVICWFFTFTYFSNFKIDILLHLKMISWWIQGLFELAPGIRMGQTVGSPSRAWALHSAARPDGLRTAGAPAARTTSASLFSQRPYSSGKAWVFSGFFSISFAADHENWWKLLEDHVKVPMNNDGFMVRRHVEIAVEFFLAY